VRGSGHAHDHRCERSRGALLGTCRHRRGRRRDRRLLRRRAGRGTSGQDQVGQFVMGNEPGLHIPYLYNYAGAPWKTQQRVRMLLGTWFTNSPFGIPGDEDGGGLSAFVVFSDMGFYPVTPGMPVFNIGSPVFTDISVQLQNNKTFRVIARASNARNKYIQSATLNGKQWNKPWFSWDDIKDGAELNLEMGPRPNYQWGSDPIDSPPSSI